VFVRTAEGEYRPACVDTAAFFGIEKMTPAKRRAGALYGDRHSLLVAIGDGWGGAPQELYGAIVLVNPPEDSGPLTAEAVLERDRKREVRLLDPEGQALDGVNAEGRGAEATKTPGVITVSKLNPMRPSRFAFHHAGRKLVGYLRARGDEAEPYTVRLAPWGTITGRLVDAQGKPLPGAKLDNDAWQDVLDDPARGLLPGVTTDAEGRFRIEGLLPGLSYTASAEGAEAAKRVYGVVIDRVVLKPGETRDLGDVRARPTRPEGAD
jgi:hypothetical protein